MSLFGRGTWSETRRIGDLLRTETIGGMLLLVAALIGIGWANSPWSAAYRTLCAVHLGPLTLSEWAADGLLAIFFFVAGLELKREFVAGDLRDPRRAALPVVAAVGGMVVPAAIFALINLDSGALAGWATPTATDIAFALAVLAVLGTHLPTALRTFLLTLAVVDDLLAIVIIAVFYTSSLHPLPLLLALIPLALFGLLVQRGVRRWWLLLPLAAATWVLVHESGVHATVAGVLLAFTVPVRRFGLAEHFEHRFRPLSAGFAVPVFAFTAAGVSVAAAGGLGASLRDSVTIGVIAGLVVGKTVGVTGATWLVQRFTRARLDPGLSWWDVVGVALLGGIGFTVSLLIGELAFGPGTARDGNAKIGVLLGSLLAALLAAIVLRVRNQHYRALEAEESVDSDHDGIPDVYQR
ncbi:Na+/H+ antiporter NhaA [Amorphoplanes digitatis]|uniref:Na(+)/H(+) antiporter NhaA n=1 Tax=Actinoplanes digitatis TaxID=1868 RepID=A0A7W7I5E6_9ACTN|nr:Na+/H+ antiporter NhaA [Actinoplanes digitatis]MBB4766742.1 NhaA family Na+:H+ antiporter [Actinoplanes digitatis]GID96652.1 Na(+)/H(+) antiporter NhaA [Actinoplanes digitatis]